jgi:hypothetical protein
VTVEYRDLLEAKSAEACASIRAVNTAREYFAGGLVLLDEKGIWSHMLT